MTSTERHSLAVLLVVGLAGHAIRVFATRPGSAPGGVTIASLLGPGEVATHRARSATAGRPLAKGERIDLNTASAADLDRLPGIGPGLASKLVAERAKRGGFRSMAAVDSIPGIGEALLDRIAPHLTLPDTGRKKPRHQSVLPGAPPPPQVVVPKRGKGGSAAPKVRVNTASELELVALRGIGPARAKAIVAYRQANGPFASVRDLEKVPGLRPAVVRQLESQVIIP
ncbi:MAG: hypothetical protein FJ206_13745 [Gemmatimonadetes bacterium]|nr:hypothetical protein [Gemmatimonadota bacterium]